MSKPRLWPVPLVFFATVLATLVVNVLVVMGALIVLNKPVGEKTIEGVATSIAGICLSGATTALVLASVGFITSIASGEKMVLHLRLGPTRQPWWRLLHFGVATFGLGMLFGALADHLPFTHNSILDLIGQAMVTTKVPMFLLTLLCLSVAPGVGEELFFRGYLQGRLEKRLPAFLSIGVSSLLFGLFHFDVKQSIYATFVGIFLGTIATRTGSIRTSIVAHTFSNATGLLLARLGIGPEGVVVKTVVLLAAFGVVVTAVIALARMPTPDDAVDPTDGMKPAHRPPS